MTDAAAPPVASKSNVFEDFVDIFFQPSVVFERRRDGQFGMALLIIAVVTGILAFVLHNGLAPIMDAVIAKQQAAMMAKSLPTRPRSKTSRWSSSCSVLQRSAAFS